MFEVPSRRECYGWTIKLRIDVDLPNSVKKDFECNLIKT